MTPRTRLPLSLARLGIRAFDLFAVRPTFQLVFRLLDPITVLSLPLDARDTPPLDS